MDQFEDQYIGDATEPLGIPFDDDAAFFHPEEQDSEDSTSWQPVEESIYTDDPVRVYLREMGAVPLLTRDGEVTLARKMERGKLRMQKSISRSPLVQQIVVEIADNIKRETRGTRRPRRLGQCGNRRRQPGRQEAARRGRSSCSPTLQLFIRNSSS